MSPLLFALSLLACDPDPPAVAPPPPADLDAHCRDVIGEPRVEAVADGVWIARGFDLANTILVQTSEGNVVIDAGMSPARSAPARAALLERAPGPIHTLIYTHSHIDHVGGASVWVEDGTRVWATDAFTPHFFKQYSTFLAAEAARGARQFGRGLTDAAIPCSALGRRPDLDAALENGAVLPTETFSGQATLEIGGVRIELIEAHGETDDQLMVWLPGQRILMPGDNWYQAFPNLYTIRGSQPRPVDAWIQTLDAMRRLEPELLLPSHTGPVSGAEDVQRALRDYRDAIQWVRDEVVRRANRGERLDAIVDAIALPPHLAAAPALAPLYGEVSWSARAIYTNALGWFDGRASDLYPLPAAEVAARTVEMMGGPEPVLAAAREALAGGEARWAIHLLSTLETAAEWPGAAAPVDPLDPELAAAYTQLSGEIANSNGRAYLLRAAHERASGLEALGEPSFAGDFAESIPLELLFGSLAARLTPEAGADVHESAVFVFDGAPERRFTVTVRYGVAEIVEGAPLPGTPAPIATARTDPATWRRIALRMEGPLEALAAGRLSLEGEPAGFVRFMGRFQRGLAPAPEVMP